MPVGSSDSAVFRPDAAAGHRLAVLLPCFNEGATIARTVHDFARALPGADIYVYDNNSTDDTVEKARAAGAVVREEAYQGKGNVVRRMFADVDADVYVLCDGDATYEAAAAPDLVARLIDGNFDMVNASRRHSQSEAYRPGHRLGNWMLTGLVQLFFRRGFTDMLSGYRVLSRRFVKSFPAASRGFETETELTVHALQLRMPVIEIPTAYAPRGENSFSKLSTFRDGFRILRMIGFLVKEEKPLQFFSFLAAAVFLPSLLVFYSIVQEFLATGLVPRFPSLLVALGGFIVGSLFLVCALILDTISRGRRETRRLHYLQIPAPGNHPSAGTPAEETRLAEHVQGRGRARASTRNGKVATG